MPLFHRSLETAGDLFLNVCTDVYQGSDKHQNANNSDKMHKKVNLITPGSTFLSILGLTLTSTYYVLFYSTTVL